jgi:excisionase family DNA binding protein
MVTVPEAARRTGRNPETIRRWIRSGRLPSQKVGTQHLIDEADLADVLREQSTLLPAGWGTTSTGEPMPDWVTLVREVRDAV